MLHIINIDDCTFKMFGDVTSQAGVKILSKREYVAYAKEPAYNEVQGRIQIKSTQKDDDKSLLIGKPVSEISLDWIIYPTAEAFVSAFNAMMNQCCCDDLSYVATTTTTVEITTTTSTTSEVTTTTTTAAVTTTTTTTDEGPR